MKKQKTRFCQIRAILLILIISVCSFWTNPLKAHVNSTDEIAGLNASEERFSIIGKVIDGDGFPLIGVTVMVKGEQRGTVTDADGEFTLQVSLNEKVTVSYIGYDEFTFTVKDRSSKTITLSEDVKLLDEVVVVGYGVQKKVNLTGAIGTIDFDDKIDSRPITNISSALAGLSSGMSVRQGSGQPGSDGANIKIRGIGSMTGSSGPLVIIDGIKGVMNTVNPQDIASISVLKDAASAAIYGSEAANGVILITTKTGKKGDGKININYSGHFSRARPTRVIGAVTNYADYMEFINEAHTNSGKNVHFNQSTIDTWRDKSQKPNELNELGVPNYVAFPNTNWQDAVFKNKTINEHNLSVSGASDKTNFLLSVGFLDNPGIVDFTGIERYDARVNVETEITKWLKVGTRTYGLLQKADNGNFSNANNFLRQTTPGVYPKWKGRYGGPEAPEESATANNIVQRLNNTGGKKNMQRINTTWYTSVTPIKGLSWDFNFNYQGRWDNNKSFTKASERIRFSDDVVLSEATDPSQMVTSFYNYRNYSRTIENLLRYTRTFADNHDLAILAGYNEYYYFEENTGGSKKGLIDGEITTPGSATEMQSISGSALDRATRSYFGRVNYAFKSRYLFEFNIRHDGHARFHRDHRWGTFPSFSGAWRISEESFMKASRSWLDNLKLRLSWGQLGNATSGEYEYQSVYGGTNYSFGGIQSPGLATRTIANPFITWEKNTTTNVGLDANFFNNRLSVELDFYNRKISDLLYRPGIYLTLGDKSAPRRNVADMRNRGFEMTLGWNDRIEDFSYSITGNFSYVDNKVTKYRGKLDRGWKLNEDGTKEYYTNLGDVSSGGVQRIIEGHQINEYYLREPYKGSGEHFLSDGSVNIDGGPRDGMIRTEDDMNWLKSMMDAGYTFEPNKTIGKSKIWYGDVIYADGNGDGIYGNSHDSKFQGTSNEPKYNYGMQLSAAWKGFDFYMNWAGAAGFKLYWGPTTGFNSTGTRVGVALPKGIGYNHYFYDPENPNDSRTNINSENPRLTEGESGSQNVVSSTRFLFNGNYLKLKNITFGYTLPKSITSKIAMERVRFYISGENLFTATNYPGQDPEIGAGHGYTSLKQVAFGVNVTF